MDIYFSLFLKVFFSERHYVIKSQQILCKTSRPIDSRYKHVHAQSKQFFNLRGLPRGNDNIYIVMIYRKYIIPNLGE